MALMQKDRHVYIQRPKEAKGRSRKPAQLKQICHTCKATAHICTQKGAQLCQEVWQPANNNNSNKPLSSWAPNPRLLTILWHIHLRGICHTWNGYSQHAVATQNDLTSDAPKFCPKIQLYRPQANVLYSVWKCSFQTTGWQLVWMDVARRIVNCEWLDPAILVHVFVTHPCA